MIQSGPQVRHTPPQFAFQTLEPIAHGLARRRGNQFGHGFGLTEIHAAVDIGPAAELAAFGSPRAPAQDGLQNGLHQIDAAVTLNFRHILAGEGARPRHEHGQHIVQRPVIIQNHTVMQHPGTKIRNGGRRPEYGRQHVPGFRPGNADNSHAACAARRGYGRDGIHQACPRSGRRRQMTTRLSGPSPVLRVCTSGASCKVR